jgi:hypothetical protein
MRMNPANPHAPRERMNPAIRSLFMKKWKRPSFQRRAENAAKTPRNRSALRTMRSFSCSGPPPV